MKKKTTAFGLAPEKISDLLKVCAESPKKDVDMKLKIIKLNYYRTDFQRHYYLDH